MLQCQGQEDPSAEPENRRSRKRDRGAEVKADQRRWDLGRGKGWQHEVVGQGVPGERHSDRGYRLHVQLAREEHALRCHQRPPGGPELAQSQEEYRG